MGSGYVSHANLGKVHGVELLHKNGICRTERSRLCQSWQGRSRRLGGRNIGARPQQQQHERGERSRLMAEQKQHNRQFSLTGARGGAASTPNIENNVCNKQTGRRHL